MAQENTIRGRLPRNRVASRIVVPDDIEVPSLDISEHPDWRDEVRSREMGRAWVASQASLAVFVPSFVATIRSSGGWSSRSLSMYFGVRG